MALIRLASCLLAAILFNSALADIYMQVNDGSGNVFKESLKVIAGQQSANMASLLSALDGAIKVLDFSIGAQNSISVGTQLAGVSVSKSAFDSLSVSKDLDQYTPLLFNLLAKGTRGLTVTVGLTKNTASGVNPQFYAVYTVAGAAIESQTHTISQQSGTEALAFAYSTIAMKQAGTGSSGTLKTPNAFSWDITLNRAGSST